MSNGNRKKYEEAEVICCDLVLVFAVGSSAYAADRGNTSLQSFNKAKKLLLKEVYYDHLTTFYCNCPFTMNKKIIPSDKYTPKKESKRENRLEWEHIVPAHAFGQSFPEWRDGHAEYFDSKGKPFKGRNCASKMTVKFRYMNKKGRCPYFSPVSNISFDYIITVCDHAKEQCPVFPGHAPIIHKGFEDPPRLAKHFNDIEDKRTCYRRVRDEIRQYIETLPASLPIKNITAT